MKKLALFLNKYSWPILWISIGLYFIIFSVICTWKYFSFGYNGLDLAIFNQVFYNSAQGNLFYFTIHPSSYLGDHFALIIPFLLPFYYFFQHPLSLLIFQSLILALCSWPIYLIAKNILAKPWPIIIALLWLINPFVQSINLFEFHLLPVAIFLLFFTFYFYQKKQYGNFIILSILSLMVREDIALVIFMFGLIALIDKRKKEWVLTPMILSAIWFIMALKIVSFYTPSGNYKFLYYYSWLGNNIGEMTVNLFIHPLATLKHIFSINNLLFTAILFLPFGFINLLKFRYLLIMALIYLQIILSHSANSAIVLKLHYTALFLPGLFITLIYSLEKLYKQGIKNKFLLTLQKHRDLIFVILGIATIYSFLTLGIAVGTVKKIIQPLYAKDVRELKTEFVKGVPTKNPTLASYEFLTALSSRPKIYSLHYAFIGKKQFTDLDYQVPADLETMLIDFDDLLTYSIQFPNSRQWQEFYQNGDNNLRNLIESRGFKVSKITDSLVMMEKFNDLGIDLYLTADRFNDIKNINDITLKNGLRFIGSTPLSVEYYPLTVNEELSEDKGQITDFVSKKSADNLLPISLYFQTNKKQEINFQLKLNLIDQEGKISHSKIYPLAYGLYPTTEWQPGEVVKINYWFLVPENLPQGEYKVELELVDYKGFLTLDGIRFAYVKITELNSLEPKIQLPNYYKK